MRSGVILLLALASTAAGGTVSTTTTCYDANQQAHTNTGTYYAHCAFSWYRPSPFGGWVEASDFATAAVLLVPGQIEASVLLDRSRWADIYPDATAYFSARYVLTLTGGTNLIDFGSGGTGALFLPCLTTDGSPTTFAQMGGFYTENYGNTCDGSRSPSPILLGVPTPLQLTLQAANGRITSASFTGFQFFGSSLTLATGFPPLQNATYTFVLDDQLPVPEAGSRTLSISAMLLLFLMACRRRNYFLRRRR